MIAWWLLGMLGIVGHFALHLVIYNRINATGFPRWVVKIVKYFFLCSCLALPVAFWFQHRELFWQLYDGTIRWDMVPNSIRFYLAITLFTIVWYGPDWLRSRPAFHSESLSVPRSEAWFDLHKTAEKPLALSVKCRFFHRLPLNQIFQLVVEEKELPVLDLPPQFDGMRVAHFSDVHLTGHVSPTFYREALSRALDWKPDLIALTGDIVDRTACIEWLPECFSAAHAPMGCYFVLGNHDLRVRDPNEVRRTLQRMGWVDLGGRSQLAPGTGDVDGAQVPLEVIGNEAPWFPSPRVESSENRAKTFRLLLSHSPDQIGWARRHGVGLMLAGHTHGGQGRLPWIGPVLSPSWYGSRYASGTFFLNPTTLHVTRGLSGVHLMRINCPPELALLRLRRSRLSR